MILHPAVLLTGYVILGVAPIALAWGLDLPPRPFWSEAASGMALVGFAMLLLEFVLSGRFRPISRPAGIDATIRFHQRIALPMTVLLLLHPFLYVTPSGHPLPWDWSGQYRLGLHGGALFTGIAAWLILSVLVVTAIWRDKAPYRYEMWRLSHGLGAALVAGLGAHHAIAAGRYSAHVSIAAFWLAMLALAGAALMVVYVVRPLLKLRNPYRVAWVRRIALKTWEVVVEPVRGSSVAFEAGQFVWLTLDRSPFSVREHPFSIVSAPGEPGRVAFMIKEAGDFTNGIGSIAPGALAYMDGPHGALVLTGRRCRGIVFIAGGVGIAPVLSMLRQLAADGDQRPMKLLYGNRLREQVVYGEELEDLSGRLDLELVHVLSEPPADWCGEVGQLDAPAIARHCDLPDRADWLYVVCGPPPMIDSVENSLSAIGVPARRIVSEKFGYT